jgi:hypothetical protein
VAPTALLARAGHGAGVFALIGLTTALHAGSLGLLVVFACYSLGYGAVWRLGKRRQQAKPARPLMILAHKVRQLA